MIVGILKYLRSDPELVELIGFTPKNRRIEPFEPFDPNDYPYIVFEISPFLVDHLTQYRCDIRFCSKDVLQVEDIANRLLKMFHHKKSGFITTESKPIFSAKHSGGSGIIYYEKYKVFEQTLTFNIKSI